MNAYDHKNIEKKWQAFWSEHKIYTTPDKVPGKDNFYLLVEFPYPSGNLHVGHWYAFAVPDILARTMRMQGKNVMYPIGFDAFGLPAENAAIKNKLNPRDWTYGNIAHMKDQIASMGTSFDWSREVITCSPDYYRWTQSLFLQLHKKGLVYQKETAVNWCPNDKTVLANEQVTDGKCERCGHEVEQRMMLQWNIKITDYADRLIDDLTALDWPEQIKESQRNWIGRSEGAEIDFFLDFGDEAINARTGPDGKKAHIPVFTTRPDTLYGATYMVLSPEHLWVTLATDDNHDVLTNKDEVKAYVEQAQKRTELERMADQKDKTGVKLEGVWAINPATQEKIPMYVADYVLAHYGTGAIMAVPAHDERDYEFAKKFSLPIKEVVIPRLPDPTNPHQPGKKEVYRRATINVVYDPKTDRYLTLKWKQQPWTTYVTGGVEDGEDVVESAIREIAEETGYSDVQFVRKLGSDVQAEFYAAHKDVNRVARNSMMLFELKSDVRTSVAAEELAQHEVVWVVASELAATPIQHVERDIILRSLQSALYLHTGEGVLINSGEYDGMTTTEAKKVITEKFGKAKKTYRLRDWIVSRQRYWGVPIPVVHCEKCGAVPVADVNLPVILPDVEDYLPTGDGKSPLAKVTDWVNVACPNCGGEGKRETDTLDTFVDSSWYFLRYTDPRNTDEFAARDKQDSWMPVDLYSGGAEHTTMHLLYSRFWHKALFDIGLVKDPEPYKRRMNRSLIMGPDGQKMSKSRGNVIDPDEVVANLGADTVRMYLAFIGPYSEVSSYPWNPNGVVGVRRFLERVWRAHEYVQELDVAALNGPLHKAIRKITEDIAAMKFNTAISQLMILLNAVEKEKHVGKGQWQLFLKLLAPFAPHMSEELWSALGNADSIHTQAWPAFDERYVKDDEVTIAIQVGGKTRGDVRVAADADQATVEAAAREVVASRLAGQVVAKVVYVPNRLVNFVLAQQ